MKHIPRKRFGQHFLSDHAIIDAIEDKVLEMEQVALDSFLSRGDITRLNQLRRELVKFSRVLGPMEELCVKLQWLDLPCIDREVRPSFRDVADHVRRVASRAGHGQLACLAY